MKVIEREELLVLFETQEVWTAKQVADFYGVSSRRASFILAQFFAQGKLDRFDIKPKGIKGIEWGYKLGTGKQDKPTNFSGPKKATPTDAGWHARFEELVHEVASLAEWQRNAIARYPDLAVPEVVLRARKIAAEEFPDDKKHRDEIMAGRCDEKPLIKAIVRALEEVI